VNQFAQPALVTAECYRPGERGFDAAAQAALGHPLSGRKCMSGKQTFATNGTDARSNRPHGIQASLADRKTRNSNQRLATYAAIRGKKNRKKTPAEVTSNPPRPGWQGV
jgi:hypothetical protein